ncbi:hypothetical protein CEXT_586361 [Caerostris extrusa]|uniref:Uncharacterized protein n=1 Tax=Caerostris extrusa TaxID=172846 RepID=A0AAV4RED3_CAEEX|nr:hypothetical protein CEXT_586361 [Caerostris extrusa]
MSILGSRFKRTKASVQKKMATKISLHKQFQSVTDYHTLKINRSTGCHEEEEDIKKGKLICMSSAMTPRFFHVRATHGSSLERIGLRKGQMHKCCAKEILFIKSVD